VKETNETGKIGFFKRIKIALIDLEEYLLFIPENFSKALGFIFKMTLILAIILTVSEVLNLYIRYGSLGNCIDKVIPDFTYSGKELKPVNENDKDNEIIKLIDNFIKSSGVPIASFSKADIVNKVNSLPKSSYVLGTIFYGLFNMIDLIFYWLLTAMLIVLLAILLLSFSKIKMKFSITYALSIYASTLSIILTVAYSILNTCFGVYIDIFDYVFIIIAYIYISAVILMIKSELIKQQIELIRITKVQKEVKKELEEQNKEDSKKKEKEKENDEKNKEEKEEKENVPNDEPNGSEI